MNKCKKLCRQISKWAWEDKILGLKIQGTNIFIDDKYDSSNRFTQYWT